MPKLSLPPWFRGFLSRYRRSVIVALLLGLVASGCAALLMFTSGYLISATAMPGITLFAVLVPVAFVQLFGVGRPFARYLERLVSHDWVLKITSDLRLSLYRGIEGRVGNPARERAAGEYLGILADDIAHLQNLYLRVVFPTAIALLLAVFAAIVFGVFSAPFALLMLLVFALTAFVLPYASLLLTRARSAFVKERRREYFARLTDDVMGSTDWMLAGRGNDAVLRHVREDDAIRSADAHVRMVERTFALAATLLLGATVCLVIAWAGNRFGDYTVQGNWIAAFTLGFFPLIDAFAVLPGAYAQIPVHTDAIGRLDEYLDKDIKENLDESAPVSSETTAEESMASASSSAVAFLDVSYAYPSLAGNSAGVAGEDEFALKNLTLSIPTGQSLAVLGRSGAGKSTFAQLVRGTLVPCSGKVLLYGKIPASRAVDGGKAHVGYLGQNPYLFNRSLRDNLTMGVVDATDAELERVLESVGLKRKLSVLDQGLDTIVGETGTGFSGGEEHRIALARILLADAPIIVIDEPFSALDPVTERDLLKTLLAACSGKTLIVITHHLAEIERFDRIVFIEDGSIELDGSPAELASQNPRFKQLLALDRRG